MRREKNGEVLTAEEQKFLENAEKDPPTASFISRTRNELRVGGAPRAAGQPPISRKYLINLCIKLRNHRIYNREPLTAEEQKDYDAATQHPVTQAEITQINMGLHTGRLEMSTERLTPEEEQRLEQPTPGSRLGTYSWEYTHNLLAKVARDEPITDEERQILIDEGLGANMRSLEMTHRPRAWGSPISPLAPSPVAQTPAPPVATAPVNTEGVFTKDPNAPEGGIPETWISLMERNLADISAKNNPAFAPIIEKMNDVIHEAKTGDAKTMAKAVMELKRFPAHFNEMANRSMEIEISDRAKPSAERGKQENAFLNFLTGAELLIHHNWGKKLEYGTYMHGPVPYTLTDLQGNREHFELGERGSSPAPASASPPAVAETDPSERESPDAMMLKFTDPQIGRNATTRMILSSPEGESLNDTIKRFKDSVIDANSDVIGHPYHIKSILIRKNASESPPTAGITVTHDVSILPRTIHGRMLTSGDHELDLPEENPG